MRGKAAVFGGGSLGFDKIDFSQYRFIIACDGGANHLSRLSEVPHAVIGDFDSIYPNVVMEMNVMGVARHEHPKDKDDSDLKLGLDFVVNAGYKEIDIYGATGDRPDHSLSNMIMLFDLEEKGVDARILDGKSVIAPMVAKDEPAEARIGGLPEGCYVSVVPFGEVKGLTIKGFKYEADSIDLGVKNATLCVSNEGEGTVHIEKGRAWLIITRD